MWTTIIVVNTWTMYVYNSVLYNCIYRYSNVACIYVRTFHSIYRILSLHTLRSFINLSFGVDLYWWCSVVISLVCIYIYIYIYIYCSVSTWQVYRMKHVRIPRPWCQSNNNERQDNIVFLMRSRVGSHCTISWVVTVYLIHPCTYWCVGWPWNNKLCSYRVYICTEHERGYCFDGYVPNNTPYFYRISTTSDQI